MEGLLAILFLLSFIALVVGLIRPQLVIRWGNVRTRGRVLLTYGMTMAALLILIGKTEPTLPSDTTTDVEVLTNPITIDKPENASKARKKLQQLGIPFTVEEFVKRADMDDSSAVGLFLKAGMNPNVQGAGEVRAISLVAVHGQLSLVKTLVQYGANVNERSPWGSRTPLMLVTINRPGFTKQDITDVVKFLLDHGADPNLKNEDGNTALWNAADNYETTRLLLDRGAKVNERSENGDTVLHSASAVSMVDVDLLNLLLARGAEVNAKNKSGVTPLMNAVSTCQRDKIKFLLDKGADANAESRTGITPLWYFSWSCRNATQDQKTEIVKNLLDHGADVNHRDNNGRPIFLDAILFSDKYPEIVEILLKNNADVNAIDSLGWSAMKTAKKMESENIIALLKKYGAKE